MEDAFKQFNTMLQLMVFTIAVALVVGLLSARSGSSSQGKKTVRPKTAKEAIKETLNGNGWVLVTVDEDKCGYCGAAKIMLDVKGVPYKEVNISDVPGEELEEIVRTLGIEHVPVLLYVEYGKVIFIKHFEGEKEKDVKWVKKLEAVA